APNSPVLNLLRGSALVATINRQIFRPVGAFLAYLLNRWQPLPSPVIAPRQATRRFSTRMLVNWGMSLALILVIIYALWNMVVTLAHVDLATWGDLSLAAGATFLRTMAALAVGAAWTIPVGVTIGLSPRWSKRLQPVVQVIASIPATGLFPVLLPLLVALPGG